MYLVYLRLSKRYRNSGKRLSLRFNLEIHLNGCQSITLDAENGKAILTSVPSANHPMIIIALAEKDILLGQLLYMLKNSSNLIQQEAS